VAILGRGRLASSAGRDVDQQCVRRAGNGCCSSRWPDAGRNLNGLAVKRIVTCDPHALNSLRNEYPEFGGRYELIHHTRLIADLLQQGRIRVRPTLERVIYHDPCYLGRHNGEFDAPRAILARLCRDEPLEFELSREKAMCCGAGGGRMCQRRSRAHQRAAGEAGAAAVCA
jgi:Fe-S oxidoreductase